MFVFSGGANPIIVVLILLVAIAVLVLVNELTRKYKFVGFFISFILPVILTVLWFTVLREYLYDGWFPLVKTYTIVFCCIGAWFIRYYNVKDKSTGEKHNIFETKFAKLAYLFPPILLAVNIVQAVIRDIEIGINYYGMPPIFSDVSQAYVIGGAWNYMNAIAGIVNIFSITGFVGITLKKVTEKDKSRSILWPDMLWFYILAYTLWNFAYVYNGIPHRSWYIIAVLVAPIVASIIFGKGSWIQHRLFTLMFWILFVRTFPQFTDSTVWRVDISYNPTVQFIVSFLSLVANVAVLCYILSKWKRTGRNPYTGELHTDLKGYQAIKAMGITTGCDRRG